MDHALKQYLSSLEYLPEAMRDFHDQKNLFKSMHYLYQDDPHSDMPSWVIGHQYTVDWFLWFMASRGYTLQKSRRKGIEFEEWPNFNELTQAKGE